MIETIAILIPYILLIAFFVYHIIVVRDLQNEHKTLIRAILSKDATEFSTSEAIEKEADKEEVSTVAPQDDYVSVSDLDEEEFRDIIKDQLK